jgi:hypothetical protein
MEKKKKGNTKEGMVGPGGVCRQREQTFLFQVLLKPTLTWQNQVICI